MSNEIINAPAQTTVPEAVGAQSTDTLPASTPEYAPAAQVFVENVAEEKADGEAGRRGEEEKGSSAKGIEPGAASSAPLSSVPHSMPSVAALSQQAYDVMVEIVSRDPRFEINNNVRQVLEEVQHLRLAGNTPLAPGGSDLAVIRETVQHIWAHLQRAEEEKRRRGEEENTFSTPDASVSSPAPTAELINETRALVRSVNEEVNAARNNTIQLNNQIRTVMDVATRCLREMDKTALKYAPASDPQGADAAPPEQSAIVDDLRSLRDMLADGFENARMEPIAPEPGEPFRYNEHRAENGFTAGGKIKRTIFPGFRWTQPTPPVVLLPAVVETESETK